MNVLSHSIIIVGAPVALMVSSSVVNLETSTTAAGSPGFESPSNGGFITWDTTRIFIECGPRRQRGKRLV